MAKIWPVYEGSEPTRGGPWADLPVSEAVSLFELLPDDLVSEWAKTPRFGNNVRDLLYLGYKHIVVEIGPTEGKREKWKPGFYHSRVKPEDAFGRLIQYALVTELGAKNVVRVEYEPTTGSRDQDALKISIVITPGATKELAKGATLNALVRLQEQLSAMGEERTPILQYATEAELALDAGS